MLAYFPSEQKQYYYQSELFTGMLQFVQTHPKLCKLKQSNQNLILIFFEVNTIQHGMHLLLELEKATTIYSPN